MTSIDPDEAARRLPALRAEHRDLDTMIEGLQANIQIDQLTLNRLKKRKLALKDAIAMLESALIPDQPA